MKAFEIKRGIAALCGLSLAALLPVSALAAEAPDEAIDGGQHPMIGVVTAVDGTTATIELGGKGRMGLRFGGELPEGVELPDLAEKGERPELPDGVELPEDGRLAFGKGHGRFGGGELPEDAELPERPEKGEGPELPEDADHPEHEAKTIEVQIGDTSLEVGSLVTIQYSTDSDGSQIVTVTAFDPEDLQKPERTENDERPELPDGVELPQDGRMGFGMGHGRFFGSDVPESTELPEAVGNMVRGQNQGMKGQMGNPMGNGANDAMGLRGGKMGH